MMIIPQGRAFLKQRIANAFSFFFDRIALPIGNGLMKILSLGFRKGRRR